MSDPPPGIHSHQTVLFYDGECGLCHRCVAWFQKHDHQKRIWFAPLQGETYSKLDGDPPRDVSTMVFVDPRGLWTESNAVLAGLRAIGGGWRGLSLIGSLVPRFVRDAMYRFIARRRIGWFGPADACSLPGEASRFLP